jgi:hypothetical protein
MLAGGYSWRLFFYVEFAFAMALLIFAFLVVEETIYHRKLSIDVSDGPDEVEKPSTGALEAVPSDAVLPQRKTFIQTLKFWGVWERDSDFFMMMVRSFSYFLVPHVFWVVTTYGELFYFLFFKACVRR